MLRADKPVPVHVVNLDQDPQDRWNHIIPGVPSSQLFPHDLSLSYSKFHLCLHLAVVYLSKINTTLSWLEDKIKPGSILHPIVEGLRTAAIEGNVWTSEHLKEMEGISKAANVSFELIQTANLFYEFGTLGDRNKSPIGCTSIVSESFNHTIYHARNQDYSLPGLSDITIQVQFIKNGKPLYVGNTFCGYVGLPTAMRYGGMSVSADSRFDGGGANLFESIKYAKNGAKTIGHFIREMMENLDDYKMLIDKLNTTKVIAPAYYICAGTQSGEGAVVTRSRDGPDQSHKSGIWSLDANDDKNGWFRLETNFDHWSSITDGRRQAATKNMEKIGRSNISLGNILDDVLSVKPVLAGDTVYTALMEPKDGTYRSILRSH